MRIGFPCCAPAERTPASPASNRRAAAATAKTCLIVTSLDDEKKHAPALAAQSFCRVGAGTMLIEPPRLRHSGCERLGLTMQSRRGGGPVLSQRQLRRRPLVDDG